MSDSGHAFCLCLIGMSKQTKWNIISSIQTIASSKLFQSVLARLQKVPNPKTVDIFTSFVMLQKVYHFACHIALSFQAALSLKKERLNLAPNDKLLSYKT